MTVPQHTFEPLPLPRTPMALRTYLYQSLAAAAWRADRSDNLEMGYPAWSARLAPGAAIDLQKRFVEFVATNENALFAAYDQLEDEYSRILFLSLLLFRMVGHGKVVLPSNRAAFHKASADAARLTAEPSPWSEVAGGASIERFHLDQDGHHLTLDCARANMFYTFFLRQYYLERDAVRIEPAPGDHVVDAGACLGDTAIGFAVAVGAEGHVHTFEPNPMHRRILKANLEQNPDLRNVTIHRHALGRENVSGPEATGEKVDPGFKAAPGSSARSLDELVTAGAIGRVDFIKMDIEGSELDALDGAAETIRRFTPKLAISLYHAPEDYFRIPILIKSLEPGYRLYLENYTISEGETVLYAITDDRRRADDTRRAGLSTPT